MRPDGNSIDSTERSSTSVPLQEIEPTRSVPMPLIQKVTVTTDRNAAAAEAVARGWAPTIDDALGTPFLAFGTTDEIADHLAKCRQRWGISYFSVREIEPLAPVIAILRSGESS